MYEDVLQRMRQCVRRYNLRITIHAASEMLKDGIGRYDVEYTILTGKIVVRQRDRATAEYKYRVAGTTYAGRPMEVVAKIEAPDTVIITAYLL